MTRHPLTPDPSTAHVYTSVNGETRHAEIDFASAMEVEEENIRADYRVSDTLRGR